jgi:hypothetical protein
MNPNDMQNVLNIQQQAADVGMHFKFLVYSTHAAIIICAIFSVLIFWKLCQIKTLLQSRAQTFLGKRTTQPTSQPASFAATPAPPRADDDSRYLPKS